MLHSVDCSYLQTFREILWDVQAQLVTLCSLVLKLQKYEIVYICSNSAELVLQSYIHTYIHTNIHTYTVGHNTCNVTAKITLIYICNISDDYNTTSSLS